MVLGEEAKIALRQGGELEGVEGITSGKREAVRISDFQGPRRVMATDLMKVTPVLATLMRALSTHAPSF